MRITPRSFISPLPDELPELDVGHHRRPRDGACLMEYVSVLAGERFSHMPRCTHPALAVLAHRVNDATSDAARPHLARLAPALIGIHEDDRRLSNVASTVVLGVTTAGLTWAPHDPFLRRLQRRAADRNETGARRWRYAVELAFFTLMRHLENLDADTRDRCLYALLERVADECRNGVVTVQHRPLIDRIDRRPRSMR